MCAVGATRSSGRTLIASGLLVAAAIGAIALSWSQTISGTPTPTVAQGLDLAAHGFHPRSLQEPSYLYERKPEPAWILLANSCGPIRDAQGRYVMYAADIQVPTRAVDQFSDGPAPTASVLPMKCDEFSHWTARMLAAGKAKTFAASAPEYQAWCSEDEVEHHSCR
jgi:hypothetical protein